MNSSIFKKKNHLFSINRFNCRQFDIREPHKCTRDEKVCLIDLQTHIGAGAEAKCVAVNPRRSEQLAVGSSDAYARVYDRRMIKLLRVNQFASYNLFNEISIYYFFR